MASGAEIVEPVSSMEHSSVTLEQIVNEFAVEELKKCHLELHQPLQAMENVEKLGNMNGCGTEESVQVVYEGNGRTVEGESFSESPPSAKVAIEQHEAAIEAPMHEKQPPKDVTETACLAKTEEAELEVTDFSRVTEKVVTTLEESVKEIEPERFDREYAERDLGETEDANNGATLAHNPDNTQNVIDPIDGMKDEKPVEADTGCKSEPSDFGLSIESEVQTAPELLSPDTIVSELGSVNQSKADIYPEEANCSVSDGTAVLNSNDEGKDEEGLTESSRLDTKKPEDCVNIATEELHNAGAAVTTEEETPTEKNLPLIEETGQLIKCEVADKEIEMQSELSAAEPKEQVGEASAAKETKGEDDSEASKDAEDAVGSDPSIEKNALLMEEGEKSETVIEKLTGDDAQEEQVIEEKEATVQIETRSEDEAKAEKAEDIISGHPSEDKNLLLIEEADKPNNGKNDTEPEKLDEIPSIECKSKEIDIPEHPFSEKKNLPLVQEAERLIGAVNDMETEKMNDASSFKAEELVNEEHEAHEVKESQTEDKCEAHESTEIPVAEYLSAEQNEAEEQLKTGSVDMDVEKLTEISNFVSKEQEDEAPVAQEIQAEESEILKDPDGVIGEYSSTEKECEKNQTVIGDEETKEETNSSEEFQTLVSETDVADSSKEALKQQTGIEVQKELDAEASSAKPDNCQLTEEVADPELAPAAEREVEILEPEEDTSNAIAFKEEVAEATVALEEDDEVIRSAEALPLPVVISRCTDEEKSPKEDGITCSTVTPVVESEMNEAKHVDEEPHIDVSHPEEAASLEDEVVTENEVPEVETEAQSADVPFEEIDRKEDDTLIPTTADDVEKTTQCLSDEPLAAESNKHEEVTCEESSPTLREAPEDDGNEKIEEVSAEEEEKLRDATGHCATENEKIQNVEDAEIPMRNETEDTSDQAETDEREVSDAISSNQDVQIDEDEKTDSLPAISETERTILEEGAAFGNLDGEIREDCTMVNVAAESKPDACTVEEVADPADTLEKISCASEPANEDQGYEAASGPKEDAFEKANESPMADDANKIMDRECTSNAVNDAEIEEVTTLETDRSETVHETADVIELTEEHDDSEKGAEGEKCLEKEDVQTTGETASEVEVSEQDTSQVVDEANVDSHEETVKPETQEKDCEITREAMSETEEPELSVELEDADKQTTYEEVTKSSEPEKQCQETTEANDSIEEKVSREEVQDAEILMRNEIVIVTDQGKIDEEKVPDDNSSNQNVETDESGCEACDEDLNNTESPLASSESETIILEENTASKNPDGELWEDNKQPESIEEVSDSADAGREISCNSEPALPRTVEETFQKLDEDESTVANDVNGSTGQESMPTVVSDTEINEKIKSKSEAEQHETVDGTTNAIELTEKHDDTEKADDADKEVKVHHDVNTETTLATEMKDEKCLEEEEVQTDGVPESNFEANESLENRVCIEDEIAVQIQEKNGETAREVISESEARSADVPFDKTDRKEGDTPISDEGKDEGVPTTEDDVEKAMQCLSDEPLAAESDKHEEVICEKSSPTLAEAKVEVYEAPGDDGNEKMEEVSAAEEEKPTDAAGNCATENETIQNVEVAEIPMRNESEDTSDQAETDEREVSDVISSNSNVQIGEGEKTESLPAISETERTILEEGIASGNLDGEIREDCTWENVAADSKLDACTIEEVTDPADTVEKISCASEPANEDQGYEAASGPKEDTFEKANESPMADDADKIMDLECTPNEVNDPEIKEVTTSETDRHETVHETADAVELTDEHDDSEKAAEGEKCLEKTDVQTTGETASEAEVSESLEDTSQVVDEANADSHEETVRAETQEIDCELTREAMSETEAPELSIELEGGDKQTASEEVTTSSEPEEQCDETTEANDSVEEKVSGKEVQDAEILTRNESVNVTDQGKIDEEKVSVDSSSNQNFQTDDSGCEKACDEVLNNTESLLVRSETDMTILDENTALKNLDGELREDNKQPESIKEVSDSADARKEISSNSEPASEDQTYKALPRTIEETFQKLYEDESTAAIDVNGNTDPESMPTAVRDIEINEKMESKSEAERHETVDGTTDGIELTEEHGDTEKANETDKEVKVHHDVNAGSILATEMREEKCLEKEDVQTDGAPESKVEANESLENRACIEDEVAVQIHGKDSETAREVISETEDHGLSVEFEDAQTQTTSEEVSASLELEKQSEETTGMNSSIEENVSCEEVNDQNKKAEGSETLKEQVIYLVTDSQEVTAPSPVEHTNMEERDTTEEKVEYVLAEETAMGRSECEYTMEDIEKQKNQEQGCVSIPQTDDAAEETQSTLMFEQSVPEQENAEKEEATVQAPDGACSSEQPSTKVMDVVEGTFEEEKPEPAGSNASREMDVSDSQRELEARVSNETTAGVENIDNEKAIGAEVQHIENVEFSSAAEVTKSGEEEQTAQRDTEANEGAQEIANEGDAERAIEGEDVDQEPLKKESNTANVDSTVGEKSTETGTAADLSTRKATPEIQMEDKFSEVEVSDTQNLNVEEAAIEDNEQCENAVEAEDIAHQETSKDETRKQEEDCAAVPAENNVAARKDEQTKHENEEPPTSRCELPAMEEQAIAAVHKEQTFVSTEQAQVTVDVAGEENTTEADIEENVSPESSSAAEVTKEEFIEKDELIEDRVPAANEDTKDTLREETNVEIDEQCESTIEGTDIAQREVSNDEKHLGDGEVDGSETIKEVTEEFGVAEKRDRGMASAECDEVAGKDEQTKEEISEKNEVSTITSESSIKDERDIVEVNEDQKVTAVEQSGTFDGVIEEENTAEVAGVQETESVELSSAAEVTREQCIEKDEQIEDVTSEAIPHDEDEGRSAPVEVLKVEHPETESKTEYAEFLSTIEKNLELTVETETSELMSQRSETTEQVEAETRTEVRSFISEEETTEVAKQHENGTGADEIIRDETSDEKEDMKACESGVNRDITEEGNFGIVPAEGNSENEVIPTTESASTRIVADANTDDGQEIASDVLAEDAEERVEEKSEIAETSYASLSTKATEINAEEGEQDKPVKESVREILPDVDPESFSGDTLEANEIRRDEVLGDEEHDAHGKVDITASVEEEVIAAKDLGEQTLNRNLETDSNPLSKIESSVAEVVESDKSRDEEISIPMEETKEAKDVEKEIPEAVACSEKIDLPEISSSVAREDEKPAEQSDIDLEQVSCETAKTETIIEFALPTQCQGAEELEGTRTAAGPDETTLENVDVTAELEMQVQAPEPALELEADSTNTASITEEIKETIKEAELQHSEPRQSTSATEATEEVCLENAGEPVSGINSNEVSNQLEGTEINEKHFEVTTGNSVAKESREEIIKADELVSDIASTEEPAGEPHSMAEGKTEEANLEKKLKDEEVIEEKTETLKSSVYELQNQEDVKECTREEIAELKVQNEKRETDFGNSSTEAAALKEEEKKIFETERARAQEEFSDTKQEIKREERISIVTVEGEDPSERSPCKVMDTVIPTSKDDASVKLEETASRTFEKPEESILGPENPLPEHGEEEAVCTSGEKAREEPTPLTDTNAVSLSDLLKKQAAEKLQAATQFVETKDAVDSSLEMHAEEAKTDEERDESIDDELKRPSPEQDAPVMVEASKEIDVKAHQKKSHNILSGVGSKVKHSISKVKKAITGKSSHSKTSSPKQGS